jgi:hypothetical protein
MEDRMSRAEVDDRLKRSGWKKVSSDNSKKINKSWWVPKRRGKVVMFEDLPPHLDAYQTGKLYEIGRDEFSLSYRPDAKLLCLIYYKEEEILW